MIVPNVPVSKIGIHHHIEFQEDWAFTNAAVVQFRNLHMEAVGLFPYTLGLYRGGGASVVADLYDIAIHGKGSPMPKIHGIRSPLQYKSDGSNGLVCVYRKLDDGINPTVDLTADIKKCNKRAHAREFLSTFFSHYSSGVYVGNLVESFTGIKSIKDEDYMENEGLEVLQDCFASRSTYYVSEMMAALNKRHMVFDLTSLKAFKKGELSERYTSSQKYTSLLDTEEKFINGLNFMWKTSFQTKFQQEVARIRGNMNDVDNSMVANDIRLVRFVTIGKGECRLVTPRERTSGNFSFCPKDIHQHGTKSSTIIWGVTGEHMLSIQLCVKCFACDDNKSMHMNTAMALHNNRFLESKRNALNWFLGHFYNSTNQSMMCYDVTKKE